MQTNDFLEIGIIRKAHGLKGQVWAQVFVVDAEALFQIKQVFFLQENAFKPLQVKRIAGEIPRILFQFVEISDRTAAENMVDTTLYVKKEQLGELSEDETYLQDLIGLTAITHEEKNVIGKIVRIELFGLQEMMVILAPSDNETEIPREILVPLHPEFLHEIDLIKGQIEITAPEGLLDLNIISKTEE